MDTVLFFIYLAVMAGVTYLIRAIPFVLCKGEVKNVFIRSFLTYVPYAVLGAMTFPGATLRWWSAAASMACPSAWEMNPAGTSSVVRLMTLSASPGTLL